jgi:DNA polymerase-1
MTLVDGGEASEQPKLLLMLDGHNLLFRAFSSVPRSITDAEGRPVNGIYGLVGTLLRLIRDRASSHVAVAFDIPAAPTFRHKLFPAYQGQRGPLGGPDADNFEWQIAEAMKLLDHFDLHPLSAEGFEADDVLGSLTTLARAGDVESLVVTTDRDLQQLVGPGVRVLIPGKKPLEIGPEEVMERLGVRPDQIVHWKVLAGDASDNIPGVTGIGDKSAVDLLKQYGTVEGIYQNLDNLPARQRKALEAGTAEAELFEKVVRIRTDLDLSISLEELRLDYPSLPERAGDALRTLGLRPEE